MMVGQPIFGSLCWLVLSVIKENVGSCRMEKTVFQLGSHTVTPDRHALSALADDFMMQWKS